MPNWQLLSSSFRILQYPHMILNTSDDATGTVSELQNVTNPVFIVGLIDRSPLVKGACSVMHAQCMTLLAHACKHACTTKKRVERQATHACMHACMCKQVVIFARDSSVGAIMRSVQGSVFNVGSTSYFTCPPPNSCARVRDLRTRIYNIT